MKPAPYFEIALNLPGFHFYIGAYDYDRLYGLVLHVGSWRRNFRWWARTRTI